MSYLDEADYDECVDIFQFLDKNNNNKIELRELCDGLSEFGLNLNFREIKALLTHFGKESHESLNFNEFCEFYKQSIMAHDLSKDEVLNLFNETDLNKDGYLDLMELKGMLIDKGENLNPDEIHALLRDFDYNRDSRLSLDEFFDSAYKK